MTTIEWVGDETTDKYIPYFTIIRDAITLNTIIDNVVGIKQHPVMTALSPRTICSHNVLKKLMVANDENKKNEHKFPPTTDRVNIDIGTNCSFTQNASNATKTINNPRDPNNVYIVCEDPHPTELVSDTPYIKTTIAPVRVKDPT